MRFEYKPSAGSTWSTACTDVTPPSPFSCSWNTTTVADGSYDLRWSRSTPPATCAPRPRSTARVVDNTGPVADRHEPGHVPRHHDDQRHRDRRHRRRRRGRVDPVQPRRRQQLDDDLHGRRRALLLHLELGRRAPTAPTTSARSPRTRSATRAPRRSAAPTSTTPARPAPTSRAPTAASTTGSTPATPSSSPTARRSRPPRSSPAGAAQPRGDPRARQQQRHLGLDGVLRRREHARRSGCSPPAPCCRSTLDYVSGPTVFNATIARSGSTFTVTIGSLISGAVTSSAKGKNADDLAARARRRRARRRASPCWPTTVTESGGNDNDF